MGQRLVVGCLVVFASVAMGEEGYRRPSEAVLKVLDVPPTPVGVVNPSRTHMILAQGVRYPGIGEAARPFLGLAGLRIDPANTGTRLPAKYVGYTLKRLADGGETVVGVPAG